MCVRNVLFAQACALYTSCSYNLTVEADFGDKNALTNFSTWFRSDENLNNKAKSDVPTAKSTLPIRKTEIKVDQNDHPVVLNHSLREGAIERPKTLKFLAASVAYQYSTIAAVKRLPYTPDPGKLKLATQDVELQTLPSFKWLSLCDSLIRENLYGD